MQTGEGPGSLSLPAHHLSESGIELSMRARLSQQRAEALNTLLRRVAPHNVVTALSVMQLLGMRCDSPPGLLHMRRPAELVHLSAFRSCTSSETRGVHSSLSRFQFGLLEKPSCVTGGGPPGQSYVTHFSVHRCIFLMVRGNRLIAGGGGTVAQRICLSTLTRWNCCLCGLAKQRRLMWANDLLFSAGVWMKAWIPLCVPCLICFHSYNYWWIGIWLSAAAVSSCHEEYGDRCLVPL